MKKLLLFYFIIVGLPVSAQKFQGYYVTNSSDTIECNINLTANIFRKDILNFKDVSKVVRLVDTEGKKKFKPLKIASFVIFNPNGETYKFVSLPEDKTFFFHEIIKGRISLYKAYSTNPYDKSQVNLIYIYKGNSLVPLNILNRKKRVSSFLEDNHEIAVKKKGGKSAVFFKYFFCMSNHLCAYVCCTMYM